MPKRKSPNPYLLAALVLAGCADTAPRAGADVLMAIDASGSARPDLAGYVTAASLVAQQLDPERDRLTLFRFDNKTSELYDGPRPKLLESFELKLANDLATESDRKGTLPALAIKAIAEAIARAPGKKPKIVVLLTDGGNDDLRHAALPDSHAAAQRLATDPTVLKVIVAGVRPGLRESVRAHLSPLQNKLVLAELDGVATEVR